MAVLPLLLVGLYAASLALGAEESVTKYVRLRVKTHTGHNLYGRPLQSKMERWL